MTNMFERATREKVRFHYKGYISVEDLWDLSLESLDSIYGNLECELDKLPKKSLLSNNSTQRSDIEFKQDIIKYIVETKKLESDLAKSAKENADKKQMLLEILEAKKNENYKNMSVEELTDLISNL